MRGVEVKHVRRKDVDLEKKILSRIFCGKFVQRLRRAYARDELDLAGDTEGLRDPAQWHTFVDALFETDWVVFTKPAFGAASAVLRYLGRYTASGRDQQSSLDRLRR
jgi:Putative transposase